MDRTSPHHSDTDPEEEKNASAPEGGEEEDVEGRIEQLKEELHAREFEDTSFTGSVSRKKYQVKEDWEEPEASDGSEAGTADKAESDNKKSIGDTFRSFMRSENDTTQKTRSWLTTFLWASAVFFVIALGVAIYGIFFGNIFSAEQVEISASGPVSVVGGEDVEVTVEITNNNDTPIESATLTAHYPVGAYQSSDSQQELSRDTESLGRIPPHETVQRTVQFALFGEQDTKKTIHFALEFRFEGSNAMLEKETTYAPSITSSPVNLSFDAPDNITRGQEFSSAITVEANTEEAITDLLLSLDTPARFRHTGADPSPDYGQDTWVIDELAPGERKTITVSGSMNTNQPQSALFVARVGKRASPQARSIGVIYGSHEESVDVGDPFVDLGVTFNGESPDTFVARNQEKIRANVEWRSTIQERVENGEIEVELSERGVDKRSIQVGSGGFYQSANNTVVWSEQGTEELSTIRPGEGGEVQFDFVTVPLYGQSDEIYLNPTIDVTLRARGTLVTEEGTSEEVHASKQESVKVATDVRLLSRVVHTVGPFENEGPIPPRVEEETTYTVLLNITNSSNAVRNAEVTTTLPPYVTWTGRTSTGELRYNDSERRVVWDLGNIQPGVGITRAARQAAFQVAITPSVSQEGRMPHLTNEFIFTGRDQFTNTALNETHGEVTTVLTSDPNIEDEGRVQGE